MADAMLALHPGVQRLRPSAHDWNVTVRQNRVGSAARRAVARGDRTCGTLSRESEGFSRWDRAAGS
jgi:hypothetical protein